MGLFGRRGSRRRKWTCPPIFCRGQTATDAKLRHSPEPRRSGVAIA
ncbi:hypothetical protein ACFSTI_09015 [Rhizorhabdus histidinilytica]